MTQENNNDSVTLTSQEVLRERIVRQKWDNIKCEWIDISVEESFKVINIKKYDNNDT